MQDFEALKASSDFKYDVQRYGYNINFSELEISRGNRNYNRILNRLKQLNLPDPSKFKYTTLTKKELKEYLLSLLTKIFGPEYREKIEEYNSLLRLAPIENPFDAAIESDLTNDIPTLKNIHVSNQRASIQVVSTAHEYIHALLLKYITFNFNDIMSNYHYKELLNIVIEYIVCYELSKILKGDLLEEKHNIIRLHTNQQHIIEHESCEKLETQLRKCNPREISYYKDYIEFESHSSYGYILSDIYATRLFDIYKDDPKTLLNIMKSIIEGQKSISELIEFFGLSLVDEKTILTYNKRLDNIPKL